MLWKKTKNSGTDQVATDPTNKEWSLIQKVVLTHSNELRRSRRWGVLFKSLTFLYIFGAGYMLFFNDSSPGSTVPEETGGHVAVVEVHGQIGLERGVTLESHRQPLRRAFAHPDTRAVVLDINSPGGSPVHSQQLYQLIVSLREQYPEKPVYAVISEMGASGAYYIAAAADQIWASEASLVGSIGVVSGGFGFSDAMERFGIERRMYTAGESKGFLDPFMPVDDVEIDHWQTVLGDIHGQFIRDVKAGRGDRVNGGNELYSGLVWSGNQAVSNGLVDSIGTKYSVAMKYAPAELLSFQPRRDPLRQFLSEFGVSVGEGFAGVMLKGTTDRLMLQ